MPRDIHWNCSELISLSTAYFATFFIQFAFQRHIFTTNSLAPITSLFRLSSS